MLVSSCSWGKATSTNEKKKLHPKSLMSTGGNDLTTFVIEVTKVMLCGSNKLRINKKPVSLQCLQIQARVKNLSSTCLLTTAWLAWDGHENVEEGECHSWHRSTFKIANFGTQCWCSKNYLRPSEIESLNMSQCFFSNGFPSKCPSFEASFAGPLGRTSRVKPAASEWTNAIGKRCASP